MFLVGATGQLLTLMLTIGLPFVFLFSGHQKVELTQHTSVLEVSLDVVSNVQIENNSLVFDFADYAEINKQQFILDFSPPNKNPFAVFYLNCESLWKNSSGNKAPPTFI